MSSILLTLRSATPERHHKAVEGLRRGTLRVTITRQTDREVCALVRNGDGHEYGVNLSEHGNFCSCKDALCRGTTCKHQLALCLFCLQQSESTEDRIHLWFPDGTAALCGATHPKRIWQRWNDNVFSWPDVCPACVYAWTHPVNGR